MLSKLLKLNETISFSILETKMELDSMELMDDEDYDIDEENCDIEELMREEQVLDSEIEEYREFLMDKLEVLQIYKETVSAVLTTTNSLINGGLLSNFEQIDKFIEGSMSDWPKIGEGE